MKMSFKDSLVLKACSPKQQSSEVGLRSDWIVRVIFIDEIIMGHLGVGPS
jgi:hypothetical protein